MSNHRPGTITRIDPDSATVTATVDIGGGHIGPPLEAAGRLWVVSADASKVVAVDPATNKVAGSLDCPCEEEGGLVWVAGYLWFGAPDNMFWRIDPGAMRFTDQVKGVPVATSIVVDDRWFGIDDARVLYEFDPKTLKTIDTSDLKSTVGTGTMEATAVGSTIWFSTNDGTISRYDVTSGDAARVGKVDVKEFISDPFAPVLMAATTDALYLRPSPEVILHVDPASGQIVKRFDGMPRGEYQSYIVVAFNSLWVPHFSNASIWRVALEAL